MWTRWSVSTRVEQVNVASPSSNSRIALVRTSTPIAGSRTIDGLDPPGSAPNSIRDRLIAVAADVEERATAGVELVADVRRIVVEVREPALDRAQPADPARRDELQGGDPRRVVAVHERLHQAHAGVRADVDHPLGVGGRHAPAASRTGRACRPGPPRSSTRRVGGSAAGCRRRRRRGRRGAPRTSRGRVGMPSSRRPAAPGRASREAIATTSQRSALHARDDLLASRCPRSKDPPAAALRHRSLRSRVRMLDTDRASGPVCHNIWKRGTQNR